MKKQILLTALLATAFGINAVSIQQLLDQGRCPKVINQGSILGNYLFLNKLEIDDLTGLENIPHIETVTCLQLQNNQITTIDGFFNCLPNLKNLLLQDNKIKSIDSCFDNCQVIEFINLNYNSLNSLNIDKIIQLSSLQDLSVHNNYLNLTEAERGILETRSQNWCFTYGSQREPEIDLS